MGNSGQRNHEEVRYYLHLRDHVVDAPSIGPKSADRLNRMGIRTVIDLLQADATQVARQFDHRQVSPDVVRDWQDQARLVCQIPYLRAHDAQFLVACDVRTPHKLATHDAQLLWRQVDHFADSAEGRRILRQGPKPDLAEVQHWIQWARDARALDAA